MKIETLKGSGLLVVDGLTRPARKDFTNVCDAVYNVGDPREWGAAENVPAEYKKAWAFYWALVDRLGSFDEVVAFGVVNGLIDRQSGFWDDYGDDLKHDKKRFENFGKMLDTYKVK